MATELNERQYPLIALIDLGVANVGSGNGVTVDLPPGAFLVDISGNIGTSFNTAGTGTMTVTLSDGTTTFISAENAKASANTAIAVDLRSKFFPSGGTLTASLTEVLDTTAATAGRIFIAVAYVILNRTNEIQG